MVEFSIFEKVRTSRRMIDAAMPSDDSAPAVPAPAPKPKGTRRVPTRDPATGKIIWKDIPED